MVSSLETIFCIFALSRFSNIFGAPVTSSDSNALMMQTPVPQFLVSNSSGSNQTSSSSSTCRLKILNHEFQEYLENIKDDDVELVHIYTFFPNYTVTPFGVYGDYYRSNEWYLSTYTQGLTLLQLPFQYDVYSFSILNFGVDEIGAEIQDFPQGCLGELPQEESMFTVRRFMFEILNNGKPMPTTSLCNLVVRSVDGAARLMTHCCKVDATGNIECKDDEAGTWISILYWLLSGLYLVFFLCSPLFLPQSMYNAAYVMSEYMVKLKDPVRLKLYVSDSLDSVVKHRWRLLASDIKAWKKFVNTLQYIPVNETVPIQVSELQIKVKGKRIFEGNSPPSGLLQSLYDNFIRCKVKNINPFTDCCESSIYGKCADKFINYNITWHTCMKIFIKVLLLILLPAPFYIRVFVFYYFESERYEERRINALINQLETEYDFKTDTFLQYLTPVHPMFITAYLIYLLSGVIISFSNESAREKMKNVIRGSLQNMREVTYVSGVQMLTKLALNPFKTFGILGFLIAPFYWILVVPLGLILFLFYSIPTAYLIIAICRHSFQQFPIFEKPKSFIPKKASEKFKSLTSKLAANPFAVIDKTEMQPTTRKEQILRTIYLVLAISFCLSVLFAYTLILSECLIFFLKIAAFTMMGIIVNAGSTLKYVTMAMLVLLYMHDCYQDVYQNYVTFTKDIIEILSDRAENIKEVASLSADEQNNAAFQVTLPKTATPIRTTFNNDKGEPRWNCGHLSLFLDKYDTPRLPLRLFQRMCEIQTWGSPGLVSINLLRATRKFLTIVIFLAFVLVVVLAFGNVYRVSSANQTLATMAGGFVPLLLKNVFSSRVVKLNLKTLSFKGQMDEVLTAYSQNWPISDLSFIWGEELDEADNAMDETATSEKSLSKSKSDLTTPEDAGFVNGAYRKFSEIGLSVSSVRQPASDAEEVVDIFIDLTTGVNENTWRETPPETPDGSYTNLHTLTSTPMKFLMLANAVDTFEVQMK